MSSVNIQFYDTKKSEGLEVATPAENHSKQFLLDYIQSNKEAIDTRLTKNGAMLFRGFDIHTAEDFEQVALHIDSELKNNYLGTSPRNSISKYTFSASELPDFYPIMQHCEMSFLRFPPRKLFFFCQTAPEKNGETPICDFRKVAAQLAPEVKKAFREKGIKTIRNYDGLKAKAKWDLWQLKRWDEMFQTKDKKVAEAKCKEYEIEFEWLEEDKLRLYNRQDAFVKHPVTGEDVWFNHLQVFHRDAAAIEYKHIARHQKSFRASMYSLLTSFLTKVKTIGMKNENLGTHCTYLDGSEIPTEHLEHLEKIIWNNMQIFPWQKGDVLAIDNFSTSHGRLPYKGPRNILVCWAANK